MMRYSIKPIIPLVLFFCVIVYNAFSEDRPGENDIVSSLPLYNKVTASVGDTIRGQIGGKLYFINDTAPTDSITLINAYYYDCPESGLYRSYEFIVHNTCTFYHERFKQKSLEKSYKAYFEQDDEMPGWYDKYYKLYYENLIEDQKTQVKNVDISPSIKQYTGYWIYLREYNNRFYIDDEWAWLSSFCITDSLVIDHFMDGPSPSVIECFKVEANGDFSITRAGVETEESYRVIDKNLQIYESRYYYIVPASKANNFEIIEYANNTGDLI